MNETKNQSNMVNTESKGIIDVPENQKELFKTIMNNIKSFSFGKSASNIGIATVPLSLLFVDQRYQGLRVHRKLKKLIRNWDEKKLGCIILVAHPEEYRFAVVDGQGRLLAATELGYESLPAIILLDAPQDDEHERLKFEAEIFIGQDDETEDVKALEKHLARVIIGDEAATILQNMFEKYNIKYVDCKGNRDKSILGSYTTTYEMAKRHGDSCLDFIFSIIKNAGWDREKNGYATFVTESLKNIWVTFQNTSDRERIYDFLSEELRQIDPTKFSSLARAKYLMRKDSRACCRLYIEDMIIEGLGLKKPDLVA